MATLAEKALNPERYKTMFGKDLELSNRIYAPTKCHGLEMTGIAIAVWKRLRSSPCQFTFITEKGKFAYAVTG